MPSMILLNHMIFNKKGFTLIELLVVIAIIGILASVVLVSFPTASKKAKDSRIVSAVAQARKLMFVVFASQNNYAGFSTAVPAPEMGTLNTEVTNNLGSLMVQVKADNTAACVYSHLPSAAGATPPGTATKWYCADSIGTAGFFTGTQAAITATCISTATALCPAGTVG